MNYFAFTLISCLIFTPSITFSLLQAEIFPWALIFTALFIRKIEKHFFLITLFLLLSSIYGYYQSNGGALYQIFRSLSAYINTLLVFSFLLKIDYSFIKKLFPIIKGIFYILTTLGFLQYFELISFLDTFIKILIPRGTAGSLIDFGRGVTLLSSEPSRAAYEYLFIYLAYRTIFLQKKSYLAFDLFVMLFILFVISSGTGAVLLFGFLVIFYRLKFIALASVLVGITIPFLDQLGGRAFEIIMGILTAESLEGIYLLMLNTSGFRLISLIASTQYGFIELLGGGIGNWELSSLKALNLTKYNPEHILYFIDINGGKWISLRPTSYFSALMLDTGVLGTLLIVYYLYKALYKLFKLDHKSKKIIMIFLFYFFMIGSVGNPVPFIATAVALRYLNNLKLLTIYNPKETKI